MVVGEKECQPQDFRNIDSVSKKKRHVDCASLKKGCQQPDIRKWKTWYTFWMAELGLQQVARMLYHLVFCSYHLSTRQLLQGNLDFTSSLPVST
jgi:hypothetical protein